MCLTLKERFETREMARKAAKSPKIAKKDIIVYKKLDRCDGKIGYSPFYGHKYEKGMHYYQDGKRPFSISIENDYGMWIIYINRGLHAYTKKVLGGTIKKMVVPKGAKYFLGSNNDIVADQLIWR